MQLVYPGVIGNGEIYLDVLKAMCGDTSGKSMVDLMCHHAPYTPLLGFEERIYVDLLDRGLDHKDEQKHFIQLDVFSFFFSIPANRYDVMICSDGIEHLRRNDGENLLRLMESHSHKQIIFTPTNDMNLDIGNHPDTHKSSWGPEDFQSYGVVHFPNFHPTLNQGAFFAFMCENVTEEFELVKIELKNKKWAINDN